MTKLYLHIGPHKTGSTFIQKYFFENRDRLLSLGVNYPNVDVINGYGHHVAVEKVKELDQDELDRYLNQFLSEGINFISSENFDRLNLEDIKKIGNAFSALEVKVIYYYRNHADLLPSWWQEEVKHGSMVSFYEFVLPHVLRPFASSIINPDIVLDLYSKVFGRGNIIVIDYDLALKRHGILPPIFDLLCLESEPVNNELINKSLNLDTVELIRSLNTIAYFNRQLKGYNVRDLFLRKGRADVISSDVEYVTGLIREHIKPVKLTGGYFEQSVRAAFRKNYEDCFLGGLLDDSSNCELMIPSDNWMMQEGVIVACERIYQSIMSGSISD